MPTLRRKRRGFTLGEVLVTVAIVAVLAAVVIPAITSQITKGDLGRVQGDLQTLKGSISQFVADVRKYPRSIGQLVVLPTTSHTPVNSNTTYSDQELLRWRGPYLDRDSTTAPNTGYSLRMTSTSSTGPFKFDTMTVGVSGVSSSSPGSSDMMYLVVTIPKADQTTALALDAAMDDGVLTTGAIRWKAGTTDTLKFLALPINK
jgi:type IV pilus assembly protein PilE